MALPTAKHQSKLRWEFLNAFIDQGIVDAGLSPATALVWLIIFRHARDGISTISIGKIRESTGLCRATVKRAMRELQQAGLLKTIERGSSASRPSRHRIRPLASTKGGRP